MERIGGTQRAFIFGCGKLMEKIKALIETLFTASRRAAETPIQQNRHVRRWT